ncbi:MAG: HAD-IC family P-type ATPase [Longibaculum muris]|nr:HAD-IC family P-type ATPase [Longibaculum muris]MBS5368794.1 HAD-IC family P-type ATPase [Coprobacillus cateniformis]MCR1888832.1 HAD-IC family P-type ATPase [Longibaculum muris]MED9813430.1 HAD-IC family P-type ATPase [Longibaculum muris]
MQKIKGLTNQEVLDQIDLGHMNISPKPLVKTNKQIIFEHVFNLFNAYNFVIACALVFVQAWSSLFFVVIVSANTVIRIYQEIRSRNMVAKLNLIISPKTKVLRDDTIQEIDNEEIVLNDVVYFETGNQVSSDSIVLDTAVEVDESLLTGEADPVLKNIGDHLLSGSFIVSGACYARVEHVGIDNYATHLANEARQRKPVTSELVNVFNKVTKFTSYLVVPLSVLMLYQALGVREESLATAIVNTSTALLGMLPKGLVLLTSVSLAASVVRLGKRKVLVQEMFSIETLSRVDVLCLDKTGTLTKGKMKVQEVVDLANPLSLDMQKVMSSFVGQSVDNNATYQTLKQYFQDEICYEVKNRVPFSSARKWSAQELEGIGTIIVGAPEFIVPQYQLLQYIQEAQNSGARVLMVAHHADFQTFQEHLHEATPLALIIILDPLRDDAKETLAFFQENDVDIKVISGDNPITVSSLAKQAGVKDAHHYIDASTLTTDEELENAIMNYNVIGRATPKQKHQMILTLQKHKQKVAMTGDGVNDVLALKDADVSIAMGSGSDAAKQISQFVVINGELSTMVDVVKEGRLDINNVTRSASMYYLKTIYTILIAISTVLLNMPYPFIPFQMTLLDNFIEGFPSFMILFEKNIDKQKESIGRHAMRYSLPNALVIVLSVIALKLLAPILSLELHEVFTILYFSTSLISIHMIYRIYSPINWYRTFVLIIDIIGFCMATYIFWDWLQLAPLTMQLFQYILIIIVIGMILAAIISHFVNIYLDRE